MFSVILLKDYAIIETKRFYQYDIGTIIMKIDVQILGNALERRMLNYFSKKERNETISTFLYSGNIKTLLRNDVTHISCKALNFKLEHKRYISFACAGKLQKHM